jgi:hypothetical protein
MILFNHLWVLHEVYNHPKYIYILVANIYLTQHLDLNQTYTIGGLGEPLS